VVHAYVDNLMTVKRLLGDNKSEQKLLKEANIRKFTKLEKILAVLISLVVVMILYGSITRNHRMRVLDFRSMKDTELDVIISLGDSRRYVERVLGPSEPVTEGAGSFRTIRRYRNGMEIMFYDDDRAVELIGINGFTSGRFEIYRYRAGMTEQEIDANFHLSFSEAFGTRYIKHFDRLGNSDDPDRVAVVSTIEWNDRELRNLVRLSVSQTW